MSDEIPPVPPVTPAHPPRHATQGKKYAEDLPPPAPSHGHAAAEEKPYILFDAQNNRAIERKAAQNLLELPLMQGEIPDAIAPLKTALEHVRDQAQLSDDDMCALRTAQQAVEQLRQLRYTPASLAADTATLAHIAQFHTTAGAVGFTPGIMRG